MKIKKRITTLVLHDVESDVVWGTTPVRVPSTSLVLPVCAVSLPWCAGVVPRWASALLPPVAQHAQHAQHQGHPHAAHQAAHHSSAFRPVFPVPALPPALLPREAVAAEPLREARAELRGELRGDPAAELRDFRDLRSLRDLRELRELRDLRDLQQQQQQQREPALLDQDERPAASATPSKQHLLADEVDRKPALLPVLADRLREVSAESKEGLPTRLGSNQQLAVSKFS